MKKLYSKKLGGEAFALDAAQLDTLKSRAPQGARGLKY